jgi:hypothetical protein
MNEMVERVARKLSESTPVSDYEDVPPAEVFSRPRYLFLAEHYRALARAAIAAMREPTEAMVVAGNYSDLSGLGYVPDPYKEADVMWRDMIDAALKKSV